ncbi:MAG TPA: hypothetical protein VK465_11860 [Fibrobacteria bacterium]|nr:hypothetical protein [Fibrobacteria bacterium]
MALDIPLDVGDPQTVVDQIDNDMSPNDLIKAQQELSMMMVRYTAISSIIKAVSDCEQGIARNMS